MESNSIATPSLRNESESLNANDLPPSCKTSLKTKSNFHNDDEDASNSSTSSAKKARMINAELFENDEQTLSSTVHSVEPSTSSAYSSSSSSSTAPSEQSINNMLHNNLPIQNDDIQNPRQLLAHLLPSFDLSMLPSDLDDFEICRLIYQIMASSPEGADLSCIGRAASLLLFPREKLLDVNTIEQCIDLIDKAKNIIVLTGAGCSVSCGIPDFRSRDGVYARLRVDFPDLPDPQAMFDIFYFQHDPRPFFKFAKEIYPGQFKPSLSHMFIKKLEDHNKLLRNYTQNIDTLEMTAEIKNVIQCHGSFATATCTSCKFQVNSDYIKDKIFLQEIPYCDKCTFNKTESSSVDHQSPPDQTLCDQLEENLDIFKNVSEGILKPDIVFFGENLPDLYHKSINDDKSKCDLLIVIGSSLKVKPVANIPHLLPSNVPQILINRESLKHMNFDVELLGDCDVIVNELLLRLEEKRKQRQTVFRDEQNEEQKELNELKWSDICNERILLNKIENDEADRFLLPTNSNDFDNSLEENDNHDVEDDQHEAEEQEHNRTEEADDGAENNEETANNSNNKKENANANSLTNSVLIRDNLKENSFLHLRPHMYVFHGAELSIRNVRKKLRKLRKKLNISSLLDQEPALNRSDSLNVGCTLPKLKSCLADIYKDDLTTTKQNNDQEEDEDDDYESEDTFTDDEDGDESEDDDEDDDDVQEEEEEEEEDEEDENDEEEESSDHNEENKQNIENSNQNEDEDDDDDEDEDFKINENLEKKHLSEFLTNEALRVAKTNDSQSVKRDAENS